MGGGGGLVRKCVKPFSVGRGVRSGFVPGCLFWYNIPWLVDTLKIEKMMVMVMVMVKAVRWCTYM